TICACTSVWAQPTAPRASRSAGRAGVSIRSATFAAAAWSRFERDVRLKPWVRLTPVGPVKVGSGFSRTVSAHEEGNDKITSNVRLRISFERDAQLLIA